jgi:8-oxo-dGTP pyrophosphatase MutT (NUDIX family)
MTEVPVRPAATVVLLRDGAVGLDVWLLTRATQMVFAAGMAVFPGGRVDSADAELPFVPGSDEPAAARFGCEPDQARALVGAAVREVFEETGVLLTAPVADLSGARADVEAGTVSFGDLLRSHDLAVDGAAVRPWSRWVTPPGEVRRYDTRFFVAAVPDGEEARDVTTESSSAGWFGVGEVLEAAQRGEVGMLPPTIMTLASLVPYGTVAAVLDAAGQRSLEPIAPSVERNDAGDFLAKLPDGTAFVLPRSLFPA